MRCFGTIVPFPRKDKRIIKGKKIFLAGLRETPFSSKIFSSSEKSREMPPSPSDALRCWLNQGAAPGCAPYLSRCLLGEKLRSTSTANIAECGHCRGTYIGTGEEKAQRPPGRETDGSSSPFSSSPLLLLLLHPLIFLTLLFALAARNNSIDQYVFPSGATRGNNAILGTVLL